MSGRASDVVRAGVRVVERGERLDLRSLSVELGIGRATLYRHAGDRPRLLGEVCAERGRRAWQVSLRSGGDLSGAARCSAVLSAFMRTIAADEPLHQLFRTEPELTLRLLVDPRGPVQPRAVAWVEELLAEEVAAGHLVPVVVPGQLAYAVVRLAESFVYTDVLVGQAPDLGAAETLIGALLHVHR
ncbi:MAG: QsdR family transcriptional regulator [Mycobacteriales bacterium]